VIVREIQRNARKTLEVFLNAGALSSALENPERKGLISLRMFVEAAAGNWKNGKEVMTLLLDRRGADIQITEDVVKAAAGNLLNGEEVMTLLLDRRGDDVQITEEVVKAD
jgi:hypothetical protein